MGAQYTEIDIITKPLQSAQDFDNRLSDWVKGVDTNGSRQRALIFWVNTAKADVAKAGQEWPVVVAGPIQR